MNTLLAVLLSVLAFAAERTFPVDSIKLADGKLAYCNTESDVGIMGYRPTTPAVLNLRDSFRLTFNVYGLICSQDEDGIHWKTRPINDPFSVGALDNETVEYFIIKSEAVITNHSYTKEYGSQELENLGEQIVSIPLSLESMLSPTQRKELSDGKPVSLRVNFFYRAVNEYVYQGRRAKGRLLTGGAYSFSFTIVQEGSAIKVAAVSVQ